MADKTFLLPVILVVASVGVVIGTYLLIAPERSSAPNDPDAPAALTRTGVGAGEYDSARRIDRDVDDEQEAPVALPAATPVPARPSEDRTRPDPPPEPAPPVVLDEAAQAAHDELFALRAKITEDVGRQLDKQGSALRSACWKPELAGSASSASFSVNASFDAEGKLLASGISDIREGGGAPAVGQCLRQQALKLKVPPPGQAITIDVALRLP